MRKGEKKGKNLEGVKNGKKRKKKWLKIAIPIVIVLIIIVRSVISSKNAAAGIPVYTQNVSTGDIRQIFQVHQNRALDVDWLNNTIFASCSGDTKIAICVVGQNQPMFLLEGHTGEVNKIE